MRTRITSRKTRSSECDAALPINITSFDGPRVLSPSTLLLGGAISAYKGTVDSTFYTHYSSLSSVQNNWELGSLGRQDTNATVAAVFQFQANMTNHTNLAPAAEPLMNLAGIFPGVCASQRWIPVTVPNVGAPQYLFSPDYY